jgi:hypothetical protein
MEHWCINSIDVPREIESYDLLVMPDISRLGHDEVIRIDKFVEKGGKLLATGFPSTKDEIGNPLNKIRLQSLGVKPAFEKFEKIQGTYFRVFPKDKEMLKDKVFEGFDIVYCWEQGMLCKPETSAKGLLGFIPPAMIGPPEKTYYTRVTRKPGLITNSFGKGKTAFISFKIGSLYHHKRHYGHSALVMSAIKELLGFKQDIQTEISPLIEIARQKNPAGNWEWFGLLNHSGQLGNGFNNPLPIQNVRFKFTPVKEIKSVKSLQTEKEIKFSTEGNWCEITLPNLGSFDVVLVEY